MTEDRHFLGGLQVKPAPVEDWYGCYSGGRGDLFLPQSNRHPAKMAVGLCFRILDHGRKRGWWKPGDVILDPMCGIGTTLICALASGYRVVGVELEQHFVSLCIDNLQHTFDRFPAIRKAEQDTGRLWAELFIGDARNLPHLFRRTDAGLISPPYAGPPGHADSDSELPGGLRFEKKQFGSYSSAISSPPYGDAALSDGSGVSAQVRRWVKEFGMDEAVKLYRREIMDKLPKHGRWSDENIRRHIEVAIAAQDEGYSGAVSSPPYLAAQSGGGIARDGYTARPDLGTSWVGDRTYQPRTHGTAEGQIGNLRDPVGDIDAVVESTGGLQVQPAPVAAPTYLAAMRDVYAGLHRVIKTGGVVVLVTKNPVKRGAIRRLDEDTIRLMCACGFTLLERHRAMLAEDLPGQLTLAGGVTERRVERKSFFKRLFEKKYPELRVDHEDVLCFRNAGAGCTCSPPRKEATP